jgi:hypothetical protein
MPTINATPGDPAANSYETYAEANAYFDARIPIVPPWIASGNEAYLITATRLLDNLSQPFKTFFPASGGSAAYYRVRRQWTGRPATATQRLAWPRIGMFDANNNPIDPTVIPQDLKDAEAEFAGQLLGGDRSLDNSVIVQGLTSVKAGSVSLGFKQEIMPQVVPDAVFNIMPQSWLTDELYILANEAFFEVVSPNPNRYNDGIRVVPGEHD